MRNYQVGEYVQTLFTPPSTGRSLLIPTGSIGRIEEKMKNGRYGVVFPTPFLTSNLDLFLYDEEKPTIGCYYSKEELRSTLERSKHTILVSLQIQDETILFFDISRGVQKVPLHILKEDFYKEGNLLEQTIVYAFERGYSIENDKELFTREMLPGLIWAFQCYAMEKMRESSNEIYNELCYLFMDCSGHIQEEFTQERALLRGRIESLERLIFQLKPKHQDRVLKYIEIYYRVQLLLCMWQRIAKKEKHNEIS